MTTDIEYTKKRVRSGSGGWPITSFLVLKSDQSVEFIRTVTGRKTPLNEKIGKRGREERSKEK